MLVRADAGVEIGTGHVMRCLALAQTWQDAKGDVAFAMANTIPGMEARLAAEGFEVNLFSAPIGSTEDAKQTIALAQAFGAEWVVLDGYHFGPDYQLCIKTAGFKLLFLDDLGFAENCPADIILNQNIHAKDTLYPRPASYTRFLLGLRFALLRREFGRNASVSETRDRATRVLVLMGGSDPDNVTAKVLEAICVPGQERFQVTIVAGSGNPHVQALRRQIAGSRHEIRLLTNPPSMVELMRGADIAISAAGLAAWEMCSVGLPAILISVAENQVPIALELARRGIAVYLGGSREFAPTSLSRELGELMYSKERRATMSHLGRQLVDGDGARRVVTAMLSSRLDESQADDSASAGVSSRPALAS